MPDGTVYKKDTSAKGLLDYKLDNLTFNSDVITRNGVSCAYRLIYLDGTIYYFNADGYLIEKSDRFNNSVYYEWMDKDSIKVIKNITDNCGHIITFSYDNDTIEIKYEGKKYKLTRKAIDGETGAYTVSEISDPMGRKTSFDYYPQEIEYNFFNNTTVATPIKNKYYLMRNIKYPTGVTTDYEYGLGRKWLYEKEKGYTDYSKISMRYDSDDKTNVKELKYFYNKEPDGYPDFKSTEIPAKYVYSAIEVDTTGAKTYYVYNNKHDQFKTEKWSPTRIVSTEVKEFDELTRMPVKFITDTYNEDGKKQTVYMDTAFDGRGNIVEQDKYSASEGKGKHNHSYGYSVGYNICNFESYKKDADTKIDIVRELDSQGRSVASESTKENGRIIKYDAFSYDTYGNLTQSKQQVQENEYAVTEYIYGNQYNKLYPTEVISKGVKNADGECENIKTTLDYDKYGNVVKKIDNEGNSVIYAYDLLGRKTKETLEDNRTREFKFDDKYNNIRTIDAQGTRLLYNYDKFGKLVTVTDMIKTVALLQRVYDSKERLFKEIDANGTVKETKYDCLDRILSVSYTQDDGKIISVKQLEYDEAFDNYDEIYTKLTVRGGDIFDQRETFYLFDYNNRQVEKTIVGDEQNHTTRYSYDYMGNNTLTVDPSGNETKAEYDSFGNPIRLLKSDGTEETSGYNLMGKQIWSTNGENETIYADYDSLGRLIKKEVPYTSKDKFNTFKTYYNSRNNVVKEVDAKDNKKEYEYNERGFLTNVKLYSDAADGIVTNYDYDGEGRLTKLSYGDMDNADERRTFTNTLDHFGRVTVRTDNLGNKQYYEYDNNGNVVKYTDRNGIVTTSAYDGLNRKIQQSNTKEDSIEYNYNDFNQLTYMSNGTEKTQYKYNKAGSLTDIIKDWTTESFEYDVRGNVTKHITSDKDVGDISLGYEYNKMGQLTTISTPIGNEKLYYDKAGRINIKENSQTGISKSYTFKPQGTIRNIITRQDDNLIYSEYYEYDANGNKTYADENGKVNEYGYDGMGRLKTVVVNNTKHTEYEFDGFNNISKEYELVGSEINTKSYHYDANNRLILSENKYNIEQYEYDNEGNMIQKKEGMGSSISTSYYQYDGYNRLSDFISDNSTAEYKYNIEGLRASKTVNDTKTRFIYNDANIVGESTNGEYYKYYRGTELIGYENDRNQTYYFRQNSHGDVTALLDFKGDVLKDYTYNAYGKEQQISVAPQGDRTILYQWQNETDTTHNPFKFCGEYFDEESGNVYLRARYYDPGVGRFISEDPLKDGINWYSYCHNDPLNYSDPLGLADKDNTKPPAWMDWDSDGRVDTMEDMARFDSNNNNLADWNEPDIGYPISRKGIYSLRITKNLDVTHIFQGNYNLCWAADSVMAIEAMTNQKIDFIALGKYVANEMNKSNWDDGLPLKQVGQYINDFLKDSKYKYIANGRNSSSLGSTSWEKIKQSIDEGMPVMIGQPNHVILVTGYATDESELTKALIYHDSNQKSINANYFDSIKITGYLFFSKIN